MTFSWFKKYLSASADGLSEPAHQEKPQTPSDLAGRMNEPMLDVATCSSASAE